MLQPVISAFLSSGKAHLLELVLNGSGSKKNEPFLNAFCCSCHSSSSIDQSCFSFIVLLCPLLILSLVHIPVQNAAFLTGTT